MEEKKTAGAVFPENGTTGRENTGKVPPGGGVSPEARELAERAGLTLEEGPDGLVLSDGELSLTGDFSRLIPRLKQKNLERELLVRAVKPGRTVPGPFVVDATAGLGEDSLILAAAGCRVLMYEHNPVVAALLSDALGRAASVPELSAAAGRMKVIPEDSVTALRNLGEDCRPDIVLLDPMFPERRKAALINKKLQLLRRLELPCAGERELLLSAVLAGPSRIVIKRPPKGPFLAGLKPDFSVQGRSVRYDCIVNPGSRAGALQADTFRV